MVEVTPDRRLLLNTVFTPAAPIDKRDLFAGRLDQINLVYGAILEKGQHAVIYGERGVGKTSLANIIDELLPEGIITAKITCDSSDDYGSIWRKALRRIRLTYQQRGLGLGEHPREVQVSMEDLLPEEKQPLPGDIIQLFERIGPRPISVLIIDEFDRVPEAKTRTLVADTVKGLSDNIPAVTLVLVGVARTVDELVGEHPSVERNLKQIRLPRMSANELGEIIDKGLSALGMRIIGQVRHRIISLSQGFPHFTHLLSKYSAKQAMEQNRDEISQADFDLAVQDAINDTQESIRNTYFKATVATKKTIFREVLVACALAPEDEYGTFRASDIDRPLEQVAGRHYGLPQYSYHIAQLCMSGRGPILEKLGSPKRYRYRFTNPLMKPFVLLNAYAAGLALPAQPPPGDLA